KSTLTHSPELLCPTQAGSSSEQRFQCYRGVVEAIDHREPLTSPGQLLLMMAGAKLVIGDPGDNQGKPPAKDPELALNLAELSLINIEAVKNGYRSAALRDPSRPG